MTPTAGISFVLHCLWHNWNWNMITHRRGANHFQVVDNFWHKMPNYYLPTSKLTIVKTSVHFVNPLESTHVLSSKGSWTIWAKQNRIFTRFLLLAVSGLNGPPTNCTKHPTTKSITHSMWDRHAHVCICACACVHVCVGVCKCVQVCACVCCVCCSNLFSNVSKLLKLPKFLKS